MNGRLATIVRLVGPHPVLLARTATFLVGRKLRQRKLRRSYTVGIADAPANARLQPPRVDLPRAEMLPPELTAATQALREEADAILRHEVAYLGSGRISLGDAINWHCDFKSGYVWPAKFYLDVQVTRLDDTSDAKVPWELSRGHQLLTLARAAVLFEDSRYVEELERQLQSWIEENPPGIGINWTNAMEVALRAVNWLWALGTLESWRPLREPLRQRVIQSLQVHGRHIRANLEGTPYLRSNHFLADVLGLLALGTYLEGDPAAPRWAEFARGNLEREILREVHPDGVSFEGSLPYHGLVLEMLLLAWRIAGESGLPLSPAFERRLEAMVEVGRAVRHDDGRRPIFGDDDSGRVLPGGFNRPPTIDNVLWLGSLLLGLPRPTTGPPHPEVAWTLGIEDWRAARRLAPPKQRISRAFREGGVYVLRQGGTHVVVRCGDVGQAGNGGHSHNDVLSFELSRHGRVLVVDPGTYAYTSDVAGRHAFRSTAAHNVAQVDGAEIHPIDRDRVFELRQFAHPRLELWRADQSRMELVGAHDGYRRLEPPVRVQRRFVLEATGKLTVEDQIEGEGAHEVVLRLHLDAGVVARAEGFTVELRRQNESLRVEFAGVSRVDVAQGWVSDRYGLRESAPVVTASAHAPLPLRIVTSYAPQEVEPERWEKQVVQT